MIRFLYIAFVVNTILNSLLAVAQRVCTTEHSVSFPQTALAVITASDENECCNECSSQYGCHTWTFNTSLLECKLASWGFWKEDTEDSVSGLIDYATTIESLVANYIYGWGPETDRYRPEVFMNFPVQVRGTGIYEFTGNAAEWEFRYTSGNGSVQTRMLQVDESMIDRTEQELVFKNRTADIALRDGLEKGYQPSLVVNFDNVGFGPGSWELKRISPGSFVDVHGNQNPEIVLENMLAFTKVEADVQRSCQLGYEYIEFIVSGPPNLTVTDEASLSYNLLDLVGIFTSATPSHELPENFPPIEPGRVVFLHKGAEFPQWLIQLEKGSLIDVMDVVNAGFSFPDEDFDLVQLETVNITRDDEFFFLTVSDNSSFANETQLLREENLCGRTFDISITLGPTLQVTERDFTFENDHVTIKLDAALICDQSDCESRTSFRLPAGLFYSKTTNPDGSVGTATAASFHSFSPPPQSPPEVPDFSRQKLAPWAVALIVIGAVAGAALQAATCYWAFLKYKRYKATRDTKEAVPIDQAEAGVNIDYDKF